MKMRIPLDTPFETILQNNLDRHDEFFWKMERKIKYSSISNKIFKDIPWKLAYTYLYYRKNGGLNLTPANLMAGYNQYKFLDWFESKGILPTIKGANFAARNGHINILTWLYKRNIFPNVRGINKAIVNGHLNVLTWMDEIKKIQKYYYKYADTSAQYGHLDIFIWLLNKNNMVYINRCANIAAKNNQLNIIVWIWETKHILPGKISANYAKKHGCIKVVDWLETHGI
jgi:hypothetical protein